jgi:hypothetical protein
MRACQVGGNPLKKGRRPAANRSPKAIKKITRKTIPDSLAVVNTDRELIESRDGISLVKVSSGRQTRYEVQEEGHRWSFNLLFPAQGKFERLATKGRAACVG